MKTKTTKQRKILDKNYPLLSLKDLLDQIITTEQVLPADVLNAITQARDAAWKCFIKENETPIGAIKKDQGKIANPS